MTGVHAVDIDGGAESEPGPPERAPVSESARRGLLQYAVQELTREDRASVRSQDEFEALLVRGAPVGHQLHRVILVALAIVAVVVVVAGLAPPAAAAVVPCLYAAFWLFLAVTGGEELDRISIDERGTLISSKSGRPVETRGNFLRVAIPGAILLVTAPLALWLLYMIAFPPPPMCNLGDPYALPVGCFIPPSFNGGMQGGMLSVAETQAMETSVRVFFLIVDLLFVLPATWFLWRMLTGRPVADIQPISRRRGVRQPTPGQ